MVHALLEMSGHEGHDAPDGATALDAALRLGPEVAVIDIGLPGLTATSWREPARSA